MSEIGYYCTGCGAGFDRTKGECEVCGSFAFNEYYVKDGIPSDAAPPGLKFVESVHAGMGSVRPFQPQTREEYAHAYLIELMGQQSKVGEVAMPVTDFDDKSQCGALVKAAFCLADAMLEARKGAEG